MCGLDNVSVGDYQPIYDSEAVCKYVTKLLMALILAMPMKLHQSNCSQE